MEQAVVWEHAERPRPRFIASHYTGLLSHDAIGWDLALEDLEQRRSSSLGTTDDCRRHLFVEIS